MNYKYILIALPLLGGGCHGLDRLSGHDRQSPAAVFKQTEPSPTPPPEDSTKQTIMLAGQSNMVRMTQYALNEFRAEYRHLHPNAEVDFIPCAVGGTYSGQWVPTGECFSGCLDAVNGRAVSAILYYQGESDAALQTTDWANSFSQTVSGFRSALGNIPVVYAQIAITSVGSDFESGWASIQSQQASINIQGVTMIKTEDVATLVDNVHLSEESLKLIARRFADAF